MGSYADILRVGIVSEVIPDTHRVRVTFSDKDNMVSDELPVLVQGSQNNKIQCLPDEGEMVLCAFLPSGEEAGVVLGSLYNAKDVPAVSDRDVYLYKIPGGVCISVHRTNHTFTITDYYGSVIRFESGNITLKSAENIYINPDDEVSVEDYETAEASTGTSSGGTSSGGTTDSSSGSSSGSSTDTDIEALSTEEIDAAFAGDSIDGDTTVYESDVATDEEVDEMLDSMFG